MTVNDYDEYKEDDWVNLVNECIGSVNINTPISEIQQRNFGLYILFCYNSNQSTVFDRLPIIYPDMDYQKRYRDIMEVYIRFFVRQVDDGIIDIDNTPETGSDEDYILRKQTELSFMIKHTYEYLLIKARIKNSDDVQIKTALQHINPVVFCDNDSHTDEKLKKHQKLLRYYYKIAFANGLRKRDGRLYAPIKNHLGHFVNAYAYYMDISDFVYNSIYPRHENIMWWDCLTEKAGNAKYAIECLTKIKSEWIPSLLRNRVVHSFRNGIYVTNKAKFYYHRPEYGVGLNTKQIGGNLTAIKYHDQDYTINPSEYNDYMDIDISSIDVILTSQGYDREDKRFVYAMLGRMMYPVGELDTWSVFPYFLGLAGTGKSTLLRLLASLFDHQDVGYLNNQLQKQFALDGLYDKAFYLGLDIDGDFQLDQATFQSMVCGEEVSVIRKFKTPIVVNWRSQGGFAGNCLPNWHDRGGSLLRRLIVIDFMKMVKNVDPNLFKACSLQKDRFLTVINMAYLDYTHRYANHSIRKFMPNRFKKSQEHIMKELNSVSSFISEHCILDKEIDPVLGPCIMMFTDFVKAYKDFCISNQLRLKPLLRNDYISIFARYDVQFIENPTTDTDPYGHNEKYIIGMRLK